MLQEIEYKRESKNKNEHKNKNSSTLGDYILLCREKRKKKNNAFERLHWVARGNNLFGCQHGNKSTTNAASITSNL